MILYLKINKKTESILINMKYNYLMGNKKEKVKSI